VTYAVRGQGAFPLDMLRRDRACPCREQDSRAIENVDSPHPRTVLLIRFEGEPRQLASGGFHREEEFRFGEGAQWESFGWKVVPHNQERGE
jgi:hypothetical protein